MPDQCLNCKAWVDDMNSDAVGRFAGDIEMTWCGIDCYREWLEKKDEIVKAPMEVYLEAKNRNLEALVLARAIVVRDDVNMMPRNLTDLAKALVDIDESMRGCATESDAS